MEHAQKKYTKTYTLKELLGEKFVSNLTEKEYENEKKREKEYENALNQLRNALANCEEKLTSRDYTNSTNYKNIQRDSKDDLMFEMDDDKENILKRDIETLKAKINEIHQELKNCNDMEQSKEVEVIFDSDEMYGDDEIKLKF